MRNLMVDLESMGGERDAAILSIGAVKFDPLKGIIGDQFYRAIDWQDSLASGGTFEWKTIEWWAWQSPEAKRAAWTGTCGLAQALDDFAGFCGKNARVWSNAPGFDLRLLRESFSRLFMKVPWHPGSDRDARTLFHFLKSFGVHVHLDRESLGHHALTDAIFQARLVIAAYEKLGEKIK
jgi:hypothetical protein